MSSSSSSSSNRHSYHHDSDNRRHRTTTSHRSLINRYDNDGGEGRCLVPEITPVVVIPVVGIPVVVMQPPQHRRFNCDFQKRSFATTSSSSSNNAKDNTVHSVHQYDTQRDTTSVAKHDLQYCMNLVKERDYEQGYICGLLLPVSAQPFYFALRAWNVEMASIKDSSNTVLLRRNHPRTDGLDSDDSHHPVPTTTVQPPPSIFALQLRLQWWRNAVDAIYSHHQNINHHPSTTTTTTTPDTPDTTTTTPTDVHSSSMNQNPQFLFPTATSTSYWKNPIVRSLHRAIQRNINMNTNIPPPHMATTKRFLERIMEARESDLYIDQYTTIDDAVTYADDTISNLLLLSLQCVAGTTGTSNTSAGSTGNTGQVDTTGNDHPNHHLYTHPRMNQIITSAGIGIGLTTLLRATPYRLLASASSSSQSSQDIPLPSELFRPNFPYHNIVSTLMNTTDTTNENGISSDQQQQHPLLQQLPSDLDPTIRLKLQRHIPNDQLSLEDQEAFRHAVRTICEMSQEHLDVVVRALQQQPPSPVSHPMPLLSHAEKMCFLSIVPCRNYLYQLQHRYQYNVFEYMNEQQTNPYRVAKDRIHLFYQLGRTYLTGQYKL